MVRLSLAAAAAVLFCCSLADAQIVYVAGYAPAPVVVAPGPVMTYRPVAPVVAYSPIVPTAVVAQSPVVTAPVVAAPVVAPATAAVATPTVVARPVVTTRWRPILGGTVSRVRYRYAPATVVTPLY